MRNLALLSSRTRTLPPVAPGAVTITATAIDLDGGVLYVATQNLGETEADIKVWRGNDDDGLVSVPARLSKAI